MIRFLPILLCSTLHAAALGTDIDGPLNYNQFNIFQYITNQFPTNLNEWVNASAGFQFTTPSPIYLNNLIVPLQLSSVAPQTVTFTLYSGTSAPATPLESASLSVPNNLTFGLREFTFSGNTLLTPGTNYFMIGSVPVSFDTTSHVGWAGSNPGVPVPFFVQILNQSTGNSGWNPVPTSSGPAWQINSSDVPEPTTTLAVAAGLTAFAVLAKKRRAEKMTR
jgi:hypothetical protein